jgi:hypothetical protein
VRVVVAVVEVVGVVLHDHH